MTRIEALTEEASKLPKEQRFALIRTLLDLESGNVAEAEQSWDDEIRARIKAVDEGRVAGIGLDDLRQDMNDRYRA